VVVIFVINKLSGGGAERVTVNMADYWGKKGHQVTILTINASTNNPYKLDRRVTVHQLGLQSSTNGKLSDLTENSRRIRILRNRIKDMGPDVVISMMTPVNVLVEMACIGLPVCCIGSERIYPGLIHYGRVWEVLRKYTYQNLDAIVAQTLTSATWLSNNTSAKNIHSIPNPITYPLPTFEPGVPFSKFEDRKVILAVGRLVRLKQFDHLIKAFAKLVMKYPDWLLVIAGEGEEKTTLLELSEQFGLDDRILLPGRIGNTADWYNRAEIFAMSSETEGFLNALIEAMSHGLAVVSYNGPAGPEDIIEHGVNGLLVEANNVSRLEESIDQLMSSESTRQSLSKEAIKIRDTLDEELVMSNWENLIMEFDKG
jgi:glycosyltransferase involved in cell wall biosynthesis